MTRDLTVIMLLALASTQSRPVVAQSSDAEYVLEFLFLGGGTSGEQANVGLLLRGVSKEEDACQYSSFTARVYDPNGFADPIEQFVELIPSVQSVVTLNFDMIGAPNLPSSARVLTISNYTRVGQCDLEVVGILKDAVRRTIDVAVGDKILYGKHSGTEGPVVPPRTSGVIGGSAALDERAVFGFLLDRKGNEDILDGVSKLPAEPCESLSVRLTVSGSSGYVAPMEVNVDLDLQHSFEGVEIPLAHFGEDLLFFEIDTNGGVPFGACDLVIGERHTAPDGSTIDVSPTSWLAGTSMASPSIR